MTSFTPLVSIGIPTYRGESHIAATLQSVLDQSFGDFEIVLVDDNSPDRTLDIVAGFADPRIRVFRNEQNLGPEGNWNRCLRESRGKYFKLLPQDDQLLPDCLAKQVEILEQDASEAIALVFCARQVILPDDRPSMVRGYPGKGGVLEGMHVVNRCIRSGTNLIGEPGGGLFRRSLATHIGHYDASNPYVVDLDYWFRLLRHGQAYYLNAPLVTFKVSKGSWSVAIGTSQSKEFQQFIERISKTPGFSPSWLDLMCGRIMAKVNNLLRIAFYKLVLH